MSIRFIAMHTGYSENRSTACLIYQCGFFGRNTGFSTSQEAIAELALDLHSKYCEDNLGVEFASDGFMDYVRNLVSSTIDSYGESEQTTRRLKWWPFWTEDFIGSPKEEILFIEEQAEIVLLLVLYKIFPALKSNDDQVGKIYSLSYGDGVSLDYIHNTKGK